MTTITEEMDLLQHLEYLEVGFEVSKTLAQAGLRMDAPAFVITWGQLAEILAHILVDYSLPPDRLEENQLKELTLGAQTALEDDTCLSWRDLVRLYYTSAPPIQALQTVPDTEDDGLLTEQAENVSRLMDDDRYFPEGGPSGAFYEYD